MAIPFQNAAPNPLDEMAVEQFGPEGEDSQTMEDSPAVTIESLAARLDAMQAQLDALQGDKAENTLETEEGEMEADEEEMVATAPGQSATDSASAEDEPEEDTDKAMRKKLLLRKMTEA
jgi:hypothetical protein